MDIFVIVVFLTVTGSTTTGLQTTGLTTTGLETTRTRQLVHGNWSTTTDLQTTGQQTTGAQKSQLEGPENTLSIVGSTVTLKCLSPSRNCSGIDWQKYIHGASPMTIFKGPSTILNMVDRDRYSVDNSSGCDLVIRNVQLTDAGRLICSAIISSSQATKTAHLIVLKIQPKCESNASVDGIAEGDAVQLNCEITYNGIDRTSMNWNGVTDAPATVKNGTTTINRTYSVVASAPEVPSFTCVTSFAIEKTDDGRPIDGLATNSIPNATCSTPAITVLYSVRNVALSPSLSNYSPGTIITCMARGHPSPTFKWQEMETDDTDDTWTDIQNYNGSQFNTTTVSSKRYRCVAMNVVRGRGYNATSHEFLVNKTENDSTDQITNNLLPFIMMAVAAGILLLIIVLIVCFCTESCPGYKFYNLGKKSKDNLSRDEQRLTENPDVCIYSVVNKEQDIHPKSKSPKRPKGAPPQQPKGGNADAYQHEEVTYADLAMEYGPRKVVPQNVQAAQEESVYAAVSVA